MTTSPYDSLPIGNNNKSSKNAGAMEYVEMDLEQLQAMSEPVIGQEQETLSPTENAEAHGEVLRLRYGLHMILKKAQTHNKAAQLRKMFPLPKKSPLRKLA